ncbi:MAG: lytic transglycosylase domain-containing protein [Deltaproteobacteria bacterium]|nr:lytic transglycosylase domain-containing protein [Deltaproteobacteria bacterium]
MITSLVALALAATADPCALRPAILEVRAADEPRRRELLTTWAKKAHALKGRGRGCAAAVAAEAARLLDEGEHAARWLQEVEADLPELVPVLDGHRALLLAQAGRSDEARAIELSEAVSEERKARLALALALADKDQTAVDVALTKLDDAPALALACDRGKRSSCERLLLEQPRSAEARAREDAWQSRWSTRGLAERGRALIRTARPARAVLELSAYAQPLEAAPADVDELGVQLVTALVRADRVDEALARSATLVAVPQPSDAVRKVRAWALSKAGRYLESQAAWAALAAATTDPALAAEARFYDGFARYEAGELEGARTFLLSTALAEGSPLLGSSFEPMARWYAAFTALLLARHADAVPVLEELVARFPSDREVVKHRYWLARARVAAGDDVRGTEELSKLAADEPTDFYGLLARRRLALPPLKGAKLPADAVARAAMGSAAGTGTDAARARLLYALGFDEDARATARGTGTDLAAVGLCQAIEDWHWGYRRGAGFLPLPRVNGTTLKKSVGWRVSYATPWPKDVEAATAKAGVPSSFAYAIMRTESGFDPRAVSVAGAQGVIQLLPSAARGAAALAGRPASDAERIFEPAVALDLGAALLGTERREFGSLLLAAAAYNGGAPNVARWLAEFRSLELELFIERIPFRETRDYVKRVLAVEAMYRALAGGALALELPETLPAPPEQLTHFPVDE